MTEPNPFFRWLYRLLALGGLCLLLAIAYVFVASEMSSGRLQSRDTVIAQKTTADGRKKEEELRFGDLETIRGSSTRLIKVESQTERSLLRGSSGGYGWNFRTRNLVFLPPGGDQARWLFKDNDQYLGGLDQLCVCNDDGLKGPALALYFEIAQGEVDGRPGSVRPAVTRIDGVGYTALGGAVTRVLDKDVSEDGTTLGLLVEDQGKLLYRQFSLSTFVPISERLVTQLR